MNDLTLFAKAFADPTRIRILVALTQGELCVCELADAMEMAQPNLSTHLQVIRQAALVTTRKDGKWVYYGLEPAQTQWIKALLDRYQETLQADKRLRRDADRLAQRIELREQGRCVRGFCQLDISPKGGEIT